MSEKLKLCPLCKSEPRKRFDDEYECHWIGCTKCTCRVWGHTEEEAAALWNTRTGDQP